MPSVDIYSLDMVSAGDEELSVFSGRGVAGGQR